MTEKQLRSLELAEQHLRDVTQEELSAQLEKFVEVPGPTLQEYLKEAMRDAWMFEPLDFEEL